MTRDDQQGFFQNTFQQPREENKQTCWLKYSLC